MLYIALPVRLNEKENRYQISSYLIKRLLNDSVFPILVYPDSDLRQIIKICDGCIISGGDDLNPAYYHAYPHPSTIIEKPVIDELDFKILNAFLNAEKPVLGICRGLQVIACYFGQSIYQQIEHHENNTHNIIINPASLLFNKIKNVNSFHHQAVATCPKELLLSAQSEDGIIEAMENKLILAVQWHPELLEDDIILSLFFENVANNKITKN